MNHFLKLLVLILFTISLHAQSWSIKDLTQSDYFSNMTDRSIVLDGYDNAYMVYGGDYLYYAYRYYNSLMYVWGTKLLDANFGVGEHASIAKDTSGNKYIVYVDRKNSFIKYIFISSAEDISEAINLFSYTGISGGTSIAVDSSNHVHICYINEGEVTYSVISQDGTILTAPMAVGSDYSQNRTPSIAVDSNRNAYISFYKSIGGDLYYAKITPAGVKTLTLLDATDNVGVFSSIAIDSADKLHISYYEYINNYLKYITVASDGTIATPLVVDDDVEVSTSTSIALNSAGKSYISYYSYIDEDLKYVSIEANNSVNLPKSIQTIGSVGKFSSITIGSDDQMQISFFDDTNFAFKHIYGTATSLHYGGSSGEYNSIDVDVNGTSHILYFDDREDEIKYIKVLKDGTPSLAISVGKAQSYNSSNSIAVDSTSTAHICYREGNRTTMNKVNYLKVSPTGSIGTIFELEDYADFPAIAVDNLNNAHIVYTEGSKLKYVNISNSGVMSTPIRLDSATEVARNIDIAIDSSNVAHIVYKDKNANTAKYITVNNNVQGSILTLDSSYIYFYGIAIAIDKSDKAHICYPENTSIDLRYVTVFNNVASTPVSLDSEGRYVSISVDDAGIVHISHVTNVDKDLKHTYGANGSWHTETITTNIGEQTVSPSIVTYSNKSVNLSYFDEYSHELVFATKNLFNSALVPINSFLLD